MSVMQSAGKITPKSILRHRPIEDVRTESETEVTLNEAPDAGLHVSVARASRALNEVADPADVPAWHARGSQVRATRAIRPAAQRVLRKRPVSGRWRRKILLLLQRIRAYQIDGRRESFLYIGLGMVSMLLCWAVLSVATNWYHDWHDDLVYGMPRTFQIDARVGHNEHDGQMTHFIAENLHGRIVVIEIAGGDASKSRIYVGPQLYGAGADRVPVTLQLQDVNHDSRLDMVIQFKDTRMVYINDGNEFRPASAADSGLQAFSSP